MEYIRKEQLIENINGIADVIIKADDGTEFSFDSVNLVPRAEIYKAIDKCSVDSFIPSIEHHNTFFSWFTPEEVKEKNDRESATLNALAREIHANAVEHGFWETPPTFGEVIALCHSELSEALEAYRNGDPDVWIDKGKPEGTAVEMADCLIRILDYMGAAGIDVEQVVKLKQNYNRTRPYKHGGKKI